MPDKIEEEVKTYKEGRHFAGLDAADKIDEAFENYRKSDKGKEAYKRYQTSEKGKEVKRRYFASAKGKAAIKRWLDSDKGKTHAENRKLTKRVFVRAKELVDQYKELTVDDCLNIAWGEVMEEMSNV